MKYFLILLLGFFFIIGCSENNNSEINITSNQVIKLGYKLNKGQKNQFKLTTYTSQEQTITGDTSIVLNSSQTEKYVIDSEVLMAEDSIFALRLSIPHIEMISTMDDQEMSYNSDTANDENDTKFNDYKSLLNTPFRIIFGADGEITNILDSEKIVKNMTDAGGVSSQMSSEEKKSVAQQLAATALKPLSQQIFRKLPNNNIGIDSIWFTSYESLLASFIVYNNAIFKLKNIEKVGQDTILTIDATLTAKVEGDNKVEHEDAIYIFQEPKISGNGKIRFNLSQSVIEDSETTVKIEMVIDVVTKNHLGEETHLRRKDLTINNYKAERLSK